MNTYSDTKFVSIGFGFLAGYLYPCYSRFCSPETIGNQIAAVTTDAATLEEKRKKYPFPIYFNDNERALREVQPDVILFSPPPTVAPVLAEEVLKPYYDSLRQQGKTLPDLYAFPPSPQGKYYQDLLGSDINVCNILPNMTRSIAGKDLHGKEGNTYVTLPEEGAWAKENLARLEAVFAPLGGIVYTSPEHIRDMLATMCVSEVLPLACFDIADALIAGNYGVDACQVAEVMRAKHQKAWSYYPEGSTPCSADHVAACISDSMDRFLKAWTQGGIDYMISVGVEPENAKKIMVSNVDLRLHIAQLESREKIEKTLKEHATKGGVAERGRLCYELLVSSKLKAVFEKPQAVEEDFFTFCRDAAFEISQIVAVHGRRLAGTEILVKFTPEHHAVLYALFVRNAKEMAGKAGEEAAHQGTLLYADQRGARMAKRCLAHGDELTPFGYMAYGEWAPEPGTMQAEDVAFQPDVVTQAYVCPWLTAWQRKGFLEEGVAYCSCIDYNLVKGFSKDMELTVECTRTEGAECCRFIWKGFSMDEQTRKALTDKKAALGDSCRKDWIYHTRHIYSAMCDKLAELENGAQIVEKTMEDFAVLYGTGARETIARIAGMDFYEI